MNTIRVDIAFQQPGQFQGGRAVFSDAAGNILGNVTIARNTAGVAPQVVLLNARPPAGSTRVTLYDDDVDPAGLAAETPLIQPQHPPTGLFNDPGAFPAACIEADFTTLDRYDSVNIVPFELNIENEYPTLSSFRGTQGGNLFWVVDIFGVYQYTADDSNDPDGSSITRGTSAPYWDAPTPNAALGGVGIFIEGIRDFTTNNPVGAADTTPTRLQRTTLHEIGHVMGGEHGDHGLMEGGRGTDPAAGMFSSVSLRKFMLMYDSGPGHR